MTTETFAEQTAGFTSEAFQDGVAADGAPTAEETAAAAANAGEAATEGEEPAQEAGAEGEAAEQPGEEGQAAAAADKGAKDPAEPPPAADKGRVAKPAKDRIGDLTANWRGAQRELDAEKAETARLRAENAALKSGKTLLTSPSDTDKSGAVPPDPSQFDYGELDPKYIAALARHETKQALAAAKAEDDTTRQAAAADAQRQEAAEKQDKLVRAGLELHDDFDEVVMQGAREGKWDLSKDLGPLLLDSEFGAQITYDLAKDPSEAARVAKLPATDQAKWLGRQEAKFEAAKSSPGAKPKAPQAPPPPKTPRGNSGQFRVGADSNDFAAVERAYLAGELR